MKVWEGALIDAPLYAPTELFYLARINMNIVFLNSMVGAKYTLLFGLLVAFNVFWENLSLVSFCFLVGSDHSKVV